MTKKLFANVVIFLLLVWPIATLAVYSYLKAKDMLTTVSTVRREAVATLTAELIKERLDRSVDMVTAYASQPTLKAAVTAKRWGEAVALVKPVLTDFPYVSEVMLTDPDGYLKGTTGGPTALGVNLAYRDWYKGASVLMRPYVSEGYKSSGTARDIVVSVATPVRNEAGAVRGYLVFQLKSDTIQSWIDEFTAGEGFAYVTDQRGHVIAHPKYDLDAEALIDFSSVSTVQKALKGKQGIEVSYNQIENATRLTAYEPVTGYNWTVAFTEPLKSAFGERDDVLRSVVTVLMVVNLISIATAVWIIHNRNRINEANKQLQEIDRQKSEFISLASHQLRTPLGSMRWNLELLQSEIQSLPQSAKNQLNEAYKSNLRVIRLVSDLLNIARIEQGRVKDEPEETDIVEIIKSAIAEMEPEAHKRSVTITSSLSPSPLRLTIDPKRFREVVQNLLSNAVKYTLSGGTVTVTLASLEKTVSLSIADTGIGIPEKEQAKIFTKFARAENATKIDTEGSGLGLYIVKSFVEGWGGTITYKSVEGKGTTFFLTLPKSPSAAETKTHG